MNDVERLIATDQIRQLASRYAVALDGRDLDALVSLFVDDVRVGREESGREALRRNFEEQLRTIGVSFLLVGNHVIDFDDDNEDRARGIVYSKAEIQDGDRWIQQAIRYNDGYERRDGTWLFVRREHLLFYGEQAATNPLAQSPANWPKSHTGKGTLPESLASWKKFWGLDG
jgi:ketosteroid isomerase-like protein